MRSYTVVSTATNTTTTRKSSAVVRLLLSLIGLPWLITYIHLAVIYGDLLKTCVVVNYNNQYFRYRPVTLTYYQAIHVFVGDIVSNNDWFSTHSDAKNHPPILQKQGTMWCFVQTTNTPPQPHVLACSPTLTGIYNDTRTIIVQPPPPQSFIGNVLSRKRLASSSLLQDVFVRPATLVLILLNAGLFVYYWNHRVPAISVGLSIHTIREEPWRALSSATAHIEPWHVLFNLTSLYSLGYELEGRLYSSVHFLLYNLSFMAITPVIWYVLEQQPCCTRHNPDQITLGYSGVLFAWMVIAALQQAKTCPLFFLPHVCFATYRIGRIPWSWSPLVQAVVVQLLFPRVSWTGHVSGMIVGWLMQLQVLPLKFVQPAILWPLLHWGHIRWIQPNHQNETTLSFSRVARRDRLVLVLLCGTFFVSVVQAQEILSTHLSYATCCLLVYSGVSSGSAYRRASVVSLVLCIILDSMNLAYHAFGTDFFSGMMMTGWRLVTLLVALLAVLSHDPPEVSGGIYEYILGWTVLEPCRTLLIRRPTTDIVRRSSSNTESEYV